MKVRASGWLATCITCNLASSCQSAELLHMQLLAFWGCKHVNVVSMTTLTAQGRRWYDATLRFSITPVNQTTSGRRTVYRQDVCGVATSGRRVAGMPQQPQ